MRVCLCVRICLIMSMQFGFGTRFTLMLQKCATYKRVDCSIRKSFTPSKHVILLIFHFIHTMCSNGCTHSSSLSFTFIISSNAANNKSIVRTNSVEYDIRKLYIIPSKCNNAMFIIINRCCLIATYFRIQYTSKTSTTKTRAVW